LTAAGRICGTHVRLAPVDWCGDAHVRLYHSAVVLSW
jgi:hypothetical protein